MKIKMCDILDSKNKHLFEIRERKGDIFDPMDWELIPDNTMIKKEYKKMKKRILKCLCNGIKSKEIYILQNHGYSLDFLIRYCISHPYCEICHRGTPDCVEHWHMNECKNPPGLFRAMSCSSCNGFEKKAKKYTDLKKRFNYWIKSLYEKRKFIHPDYLYNFLKNNNYFEHGFYKPKYY
mgnify:CR=1 FL=1|jgi:hypothetical protein